MNPSERLPRKQGQSACYPEQNLWDDFDPSEDERECPYCGEFTHEGDCPSCGEPLP